MLKAGKFQMSSEGVAVIPAINFIEIEKSLTRSGSAITGQYQCFLDSQIKSPAVHSESA